MNNAACAEGRVAELALTMESASTLKAVEVLGVLAAGGLFVWWQFRDLRREREKSQAKRDAPPAGGDHNNKQDTAT
jgi:hypothetical protein